MRVAAFPPDVFIAVDIGKVLLLMFLCEFKRIDGCFDFVQKYVENATVDVNLFEKVNRCCVRL